jgi:hypothetical protein
MGAEIGFTVRCTDDMTLGAFAELGEELRKWGTVTLSQGPDATSPQDLVTTCEIDSIVGVIGDCSPDEWAMSAAGLSSVSAEWSRSQREGAEAMCYALALADWWDDLLATIEHHGGTLPFGPPQLIEEIPE